MAEAPPPWSCTFLGSAMLAPGAFGIAILFVALRYPKRCFPGIFWPRSLSKSRAVSSSALSSLRLPVQQGTQTSALCAECCGAPLRYSTGRRLHQLPAASAKTSAWHPASLLYLGISPFCGQQRSVWKCGPDSPFVHSLRASILGCSHQAILSPSPYIFI